VPSFFPTQDVFAPQLSSSLVKIGATSVNFTITSNEAMSGSCSAVPGRNPGYGSKRLPTIVSSGFSAVSLFRVNFTGLYPQVRVIVVIIIIIIIIIMGRMVNGRGWWWWR
jgi:hypothetical protein